MYNCNMEHFGMRMSKIYYSTDLYFAKLYTYIIPYVLQQ